MRKTYAAAILACLALVPAPAKFPAGMNLDGFGSLPVLSEGRIKPFDTVARDSLLIISGKQTLGADNGSLGADRWLLNLLTRPETADSYHVFLIDDPQLRTFLGLPSTERRRFSFDELKPSVDVLADQIARIEADNAPQRSRFDSAALGLARRLMLYERLQDAANPKIPPDDENAKFSIYPREPSAAADYFSMLQSYHAEDAARFNSVLNLDQTWLKSRPDVPLRRVRFEALFNRIEPFYRGMILYLAAFLLGLLSFAGGERWRKSMRAACYTVLAAAFLVHTGGLTARMLIQGRPPVTNLYSSAVFVGWAAVAAAIWLEGRAPDGSAALSASAVGFATLIIAHHLALNGDTIEMMRAVLNSNFWLSTHVVAITLGYGAMFLAVALGHIHVFRRLLGNKRYGKRDEAALSSMVYGVVCLALFFSFLGTVLGGIWADQSWGRFWGWDPKENGALLIVLWNAVILHAKIGGYLDEDGLAVSAIAGGILTSLSWFGVDMLGVGLHSYGFTDVTAVWLFRFIATELALLALFLWVCGFKLRRGNREKFVPTK